MTYATAVPISFTSFVYHTNVYWSVIHGIKRKPHLSVVWYWYHFVAIAILHQPRPTDSADINTRLQLSDTSSIPPMHGGFLLVLTESGLDIIESGHCTACNPLRIQLVWWELFELIWFHLNCHTKYTTIMVLISNACTQWCWSTHVLKSRTGIQCWAVNSK